MASCQCLSNKDPIIGNSVRMSDRRPKTSVRIVTSNNFYGKEKTRHDVVISYNNKKHNPRNGRDRIPLGFEKVMAFARFVERHKSENLLSLGDGNALTKGDFNIPTDVCFIPYLESLSEDRGDGDGVNEVLDCTRLGWCRTPGVKDNLLPVILYGLLPTNSIKGVVHVVRKLSICTPRRTSPKLKKVINSTRSDRDCIQNVFYVNRIYIWRVE